MRFLQVELNVKKQTTYANRDLLLNTLMLKTVLMVKICKKNEVETKSLN